jgi:hypothetical protein
MAVAAGSEAVKEVLQRRREEGIDVVLEMGVEKMDISCAEVA